MVVSVVGRALLCVAAGAILCLAYVDRAEAREWVLAWEESEADTTDRLTCDCDSAQKEYDRLLPAVRSAESRVRDLVDKHKAMDVHEDSTQIVREIAEAKAELRRASNAFGPAESRLNESRAALITWQDMRSEDRDYVLLRRRFVGYAKGVGTREELVSECLEYVKEYPESTNAPSALSDAGKLYTQWRERNSGTETKEMDKSRTLFQESLKLCSEVATPESLFCRHELACLYSTADERLNGRIEFYRWLQESGQKRIAETVRYLKKDTNFRGMTQEQIETMIKALLAKTMASVAENVVWDAKGSTDPLEAFRRLQEAFPGTPLAQLAERFRAEYVDGLVGRGGVASVLDSTVSQIAECPSSGGDEEDVVVEMPPTYSSDARSRGAEAAGTHSLGWIAVPAVGVVAVVAAICVVRRRRHR